MSEAYERERQNNLRLEELRSKVSAIRDVTIDIYDNARDHRLIDSNTQVFDNMGTSLSNTMGRVKIMAQKGGRMHTLRMGGIICGVVFVLWLLWGWVF